MGFAALHGEVSIASIPYVSTCQVDYVLLRTCLALYSQLRSRFLEFKRFLSSEKNCPAYLLLPGRKVENLARTTTSALVDPGDFLFKSFTTVE